ncbi:CrcB-like protein, Camphor Resistance (CrcB) [Carex littledalei]|uniref:CrcB-like protein, Camphor Resistance (CrcB) n=1 Tax=Carex littledalei TaxID=544730 RepID=A0A833RB86_9POAL|nr:CrcB-like protein, Camphor Resistance (CrcB) [Carex littledalei]
MAFRLDSSQWMRDSTVPRLGNSVGQIKTSHSFIGRIRTSNNSLGQLKSLLSFLIDDNQISGTVPRSLYNLSNLVQFDLSINYLEVFTRYFLQKVFGPGHLALTSDTTPLYLDLPSNMLCSFLMGWFGIVLKPDLCHVSEHLTVGITTGYMGSLTTFSGWNQKMLLLSSKGHWMFAVAGMLLGSEFAEGLRKRFKCNFNKWKIDTKDRHVAVIAVMFFSLVTIWLVSCILAVVKVHHLTNGAVLWLGLNGVGIGKNSRLKWFPFGTFLANVIAACSMSALSVISKAVNTKRSGVILSGIQLGILGCMSTVSTFVAEIYTMMQSIAAKHSYMRGPL